MRKNFAILILFLADILMIVFSLFLGVVARNLAFGDYLVKDTTLYLNFIPFYIIIIALFLYQGIYVRRYDFWHESGLVVKSAIFGFLFTFAFLALNRTNYEYSRLVFALASIFIMIFLPICKFLLKRWLFGVGIWQKKAKVLGESSEFEADIFENKYLGYIRAKGKDYDTLFIGGARLNVQNLNELIEQNIRENREILFTPVLQGYDFSQAYIYSIFNSRTSLFAIQNSLKSRSNMLLKRLLDLTLIVCALPILLPVFATIMIIMKVKEPNGRIFFSQPRLGLNGKIFECYKFRSMIVDQNFMQKWLEKNPDEQEHYAIYKKYKNDPRITKIGKILRKTSLDELPQLINVLKGEMSIVGPRPYLPEEADDFKDEIDLVLAVLPGITGLWQVSGRSDVDFSTRAQMDVWYMKNWSIWYDIVIIIKTFKVVLLRKGAS